MSKKYKNKPCVYCLAYPSTRTGDHIFAREFFLEPRRANLPKVPACETCNNRKSRLEHYLTAVLPFGGAHADASQHLSDLVPDRLAQNARLHREIAQGQSRVTTIGENGEKTETMAVPFNSEALQRLFHYIVKALVFHHWQVTLDVQHDIRVIMPTIAGEQLFTQAFSAFGTKSAVSENLGHGTFTYEGIQSSHYPELTMWKAQAFGNLTMAGDSNAPEAVCCGIRAITAKKEFLAKPAIIAIFGTESVFDPPGSAVA